MNPTEQKTRIDLPPTTVIGAARAVAKEGGGIAEVIALLEKTTGVKVTRKWLTAKFTYWRRQKDLAPLIPRFEKRRDYKAVAAEILAAEKESPDYLPPVPPAAAPKKGGR